jgi:hypothetical protein
VSPLPACNELRHVVGDVWEETRSIDEELVQESIVCVSVFGFSVCWSVTYLLILSMSLHSNDSMYVHGKVETVHLASVIRQQTL